MAAGPGSLAARTWSGSWGPAEDHSWCHLPLLSSTVLGGDLGAGEQPPGLTCGTAAGTHLPRLLLAGSGTLGQSCSFILGTTGMRGLSEAGWNGWPQCWTGSHLAPGGMSALRKATLSHPPGAGFSYSPLILLEADEQHHEHDKDQPQAQEEELDLSII